MSNIEILSLVVTIICLLSFCLVFTFLFRHYYISNINEIKEGRADLDLIEYNKEEEISKKKNTKKAKICKVFSKISGYLVLGIVVVIFGFSLYARVFNNNLIFGNSGFIVIASPSMSERNDSNDYLFTNNLTNQFDTYDIIGISKYNSISDVNLYDVVAFYGEDDVIYVHRIIEINDDNTFITRGDSNSISDNNRLYEGNLSYENIIGYYNGARAPLIGVFVIFLQSNSGIITILSIVYCLLMFDHYKSKYEETLYNRLDYLDKIIHFDYYEDNKVSELVTTNYKEYIYYKNKEYSFINGTYLNEKEVSSDYIESIKKEKEEIYKSDLYSDKVDTKLIDKLKNIFKKNKEDSKENNLDKKE